MQALKFVVRITRFLGYLLIVMAVIVLINLFILPIRHEVTYQVDQITNSTPEPLTPPDPNFSIVVDKIGATSRIIEAVDPNNSVIYQEALARGVAHALGTSLPGNGGNIFLFAHSSADILNASRFNSVFYLMHHLGDGDEIKIWYQGQVYRYRVTKKVVVSPTDLSYMESNKGPEILTLMTCYPPGTTLKRLIVQAERVL